jgi:outer membrane protein OmpA-like peptidoglycan-associated protein
VEGGGGKGRYIVTADGTHVTDKNSAVPLKVFGETGVTVITPGQKFNAKEGKMFPVATPEAVQLLIDFDELDSLVEESAPPDAGAKGVAGSAGAPGGIQDGVAGAAGRAGEAGAQGSVGATGAQGTAGVVNTWTLYRDFGFDYNKSELASSEMKKVSEIAKYLKQNPSLKVGLDGSMDPRGSDPHNQALNDRRVNAIRDALIGAGVAKTKIQEGEFGDRKLVRDRRVAALLRTDN